MKTQFKGKLELISTVEPIVETKSTGRTYTFGSDSFPSITTVLGKTSDKTGLEIWKARVGEEEAARISRESTSVGTEVHTLIENWLQGNDLPITSAKAVRMFNSVVPLVNKHLTHVFALEYPTSSKELGVAGRLDLVGIWDNKPTILDWKTNHGNAPKNPKYTVDYKLQGSFYARALRENDIITVTNGILCFANIFAGQIEQFIPSDYNSQLEARINAYKEITE